MGGYLKATSLVAGLTLATNLLGFGREVLFAHTFGVNDAADAYVTAFSIASGCSLVFAAGSLQGAFMPRYQLALAVGETERAYGLWRGTFSCLVIFLAVVALLLGFGSDVWVGLVVPGFDTLQRRQTVELLRYLAPMVILVGLGSLLQSVVHAHQRFLIPALIPFLNNVVLIGFLLWVVPLAGITGFAQGATAAAALWLLLLLPVRCLLPRVRPVIQVSELRELATTMLPLIILLLADQVSALVQKALVSDLAAGSIAVLNYAARLEGLPVGIFAAAISTVFFPALVDALSRKDQTATVERFFLGICAVFFFAVPATVFLMLEANLAVRVLFERGAFDAAASQRAADALFWYALGLVPQSLIVFLNRLYFAVGDTRSPMRIGVLASLLHLFMCWALVHGFGYIGVAMGTSAYAIVYAGMLCAGLRRILPLTGELWIAAIWRALLGSIGLTAFYFGLNFNETLFGLFTAVTTGGAGYLAVTWILRDPILRPSTLTKTSA